MTNQVLKLATSKLEAKVNEGVWTLAYSHEDTYSYQIFLPRFIPVR